MKVDLTRQTVTDFHCFSFAPAPKQTRSTFARLFLEGGPTVMGHKPDLRPENLAASVAYRRMIHELSLLLRVPNRDLDVLNKRNERARNFSAYVGLLFEDAKIERIVLDNGLEPIRFEEFKKFAPVRTHRVFRIEPLVHRLLGSSKNFAGLLDSFDKAITSAVRRDGFVGFKSIVAYRTGLDLGTPDEADARRSFRGYLNGEEPTEWFGPRVKPLRDFLLLCLAERSKRLGTFLQIHTGLGDTDIVAEKCNPLLLMNFLKLEDVSKTPVVLIHGGFPYTEEAAWLAKIFSNVYFELSTPLPPTFLPALSKARYGEVIEMVPTTRIIYGSDAIETPENHWLSARLAKRAVAEVLGELVEEGIIDEDEAKRDGERIFNSNAMELLARNH